MLLAPCTVEVAGGKLPRFTKEMNCPVIAYELNGRRTKEEVAIRRHVWHLRDEGSIPCCVLQPKWCQTGHLVLCYPSSPLQYDSGICFTECKYATTRHWDTTERKQEHTGTYMNEIFPCNAL